MRKIVLLMLVLVLAACGGSSDSDTPQTNNNSTNPTATPAESTPAPLNVTAAPALAAEVNGQPITQAELEREIAIYEAGGVAQAADQNALLKTVLDRLIDQKLIEQAATQMGLQISDEQIQTELATLETDLTSQGISLNDYFGQQGILPEEIPGRIRVMLLTQAVNEQVSANVPTTTAEVHARHILVADQATAQSILDQLNAGGDFAALAKQYSLDPSTRDAGGDLGWIAPGDLIQPEIEAAIFALPVNSRSPQPVASVLGYHILESIEQRGEQPLDPARLAERRSQAWTEWVNQQRANATITRYVGQ